ncbi:MAG: alpha/beta hydrolase [Actinomycetes bacterium]
MQDNRVKLRDGRTLGFADYGAPAATPVMLFHGTPGSRIYGLENDPLPDRFGIRVVCPERPGFGLSTPSPSRKILDWSADVAELADRLGLDRFHVAGESGGGPYVLACAIQMPDRVLSATLVSTVAPPETLRLTKDMNLGNRLGFFFARYAPFLTKVLSASFADALARQPDKVMHQMISRLCEWDRRILEGAEDRKRAMLLLHFQEAFRQGGAGHYCDTLLVSRRWELDFSKLSVPVILWHGECDNLVPLEPARELSGMIPDCETHLIAGAGHFLLESESIAAEILTRLLSVQSRV